MKKGILLFLTTAGLYLQSYTQNYTPLDFSNQQVWYMQGVHNDPITFFPEYFDHFFCQFEGDTVWSNKTLHKYYCKKYHNAQEVGISYLGAIREAGHKIYFLHRDSLAEALLYDFDKMNIGDTLPGWKWVVNADSVLIVKGISTIALMDGTTRASYSFVPPNVGFTIGSIIEGIGSTFGLIPVRYFAPEYIYDGGGILAQVCKNHLPLLQEHSLGQNPPNGNWCTTFVTAKDVNENDIDIKVYPNPAKDMIWVAHEGEQNSIFILKDAAGKEIVRRQLPAFSGVEGIAAATLPRGLYFWSILDSEKKCASGKLIIL
jgi:Secretion system C-terminal sorting domain